MSADSAGSPLNHVIRLRLLENALNSRENLADFMGSKKASKSESDEGVDSLVRSMLLVKNHIKSCLKTNSCIEP